MKKHDKIVLLEKDKLNTIEVLIWNTLINSYISYIGRDKFVLANNVLREYNKIKKEIKHPETSVEYIIYKLWKPIVSVVKSTENGKSNIKKTNGNKEKFSDLGEIHARIAFETYFQFLWNIYSTSWKNSKIKRNRSFKTFIKK